MTYVFPSKGYNVIIVMVVSPPLRPVSWDGTEYRLDVAPSYHGSMGLSNLAKLCSADSER